MREQSGLIKLKLEYIWLDGFNPWGLRSKVKVLTTAMSEFESIEKGGLTPIPDWGFDGSSTGQATGLDSDCILKPVRVFPDAIRFDNTSFVVLCEVFNGDGTPHETNKRNILTYTSKLTEEYQPWFGFEQEYTILKDDRPIGFPSQGYPAPQGIYYCSAGGDRAFGRFIADEHMNACIRAGMSITGTNAEVMPGQWEVQIGGPDVGPLEASDQLWVARWFLLKIAERFGQGTTVTFDPKPMLGDWKVAGCHTNFSTNRMRSEGGISHIEQACKRLSDAAEKHLKGYGEGIESRLTGEHETCSYRDFRWGVADRTASIRIPRHVESEGMGYLEDRRPNANCDPYVVSQLLLETICMTE